MGRFWTRFDPKKAERFWWVVGRAFASYFLSFEGDTRLELMQRTDVPETQGRQRLGYAHLAISLGSEARIDSPERQRPPRLRRSINKDRSDTSSGATAVVPCGMGTVTKRSVSIDSALYDGVVEEARESHMSVSAALGEGAQLWLIQRRGLRAVEQWEADHGALSSAELEEADHALDSALAIQG